MIKATDPIDDLLRSQEADAETRELLERASIDGLDVLGLRDYSTITLSEVAFNFDVLASEVVVLTRRVEALENGC